MKDTLHIVYEDNDLIVCHKKSGIPVQSARLGQQDMVSMLSNYLAEQRAQMPEQSKSGKNKKNAGKQSPIPQIHVVHRLDQPVEGILVFAKNKKAADGLTRQIMAGTVKKIYHAVCEVSDSSEIPSYRFGDDNRKTSETGAKTVLVDYLKKDGRTNTSSVVQAGTKDAKRAELAYQILQVHESCLLAEIDLKTGRHHQIRVQMSHAGLPLYGDRKYSSGEKKGALGLCAVSPSFVHPATQKSMQFHIKPEAEIFRLFDSVYENRL